MSLSHRLESSDASVATPYPTFKLVGTLDGLRVTATGRGQLTQIDPALRDAARELVVRSTLVGIGALRQRASLSGGSALALATLIRACDTVEECSYARDHIAVDYRR